VVVVVFFALELLFGMIQAFIFAVLTLVFTVIATAEHGGHGDEHH
jgi:F0F1-type ATP synthase membrane subunit a